MDEIDKIEIRRQGLIRSWGPHAFLSNDVPYLIDLARGIGPKEDPDEMIIKAFKHVVKRKHLHDPKGCEECFEVEVAAEKVSR